MGEDAGLGGNFIPADKLVEQAQQVADHDKIVGGRIDADDRITRAAEQSIQTGGSNASQIVGGVIGLQPDGHCSGQADRVAKTSHHLTLARDEEQILIAHQP